MTWIEVSRKSMNKLEILSKVALNRNTLKRRIPRDDPR